MDRRVKGMVSRKMQKKLCPSLLGITNSMPSACNSITVVSFKIIFLISDFRLSNTLVLIYYHYYVDILLKGPF